MSGKKMEGNEQQRRRAAREARKRGNDPSAEGTTMGASKQRRHLPQDEDHQERKSRRSVGASSPTSPRMSPTRAPATGPRRASDTAGGLGHGAPPRAGPTSLPVRGKVLAAELGHHEEDRHDDEQPGDSSCHPLPAR